MKKYLLLIVAVAALAGCASPFSEFYVDRSGGQPVIGNPRFIQSVGEPEIRRGGNPPDDLIAMLEEGYAPLGESSFNAGNVRVDDAKAQAKAVHASVVIVYTKFTNTVSGSMPLITPNTTTSYTNANGMYGGRAFNGSAQTTTYGTQTTYIPYSVNRSDYLAVYYIRVRGSILGVHLRAPTADEHKSAGTNSGAIVMAVIKGTPAFKADIFRGDLITAIGSSHIYGKSDLNAALEQYKGKPVTIGLVRDGIQITKTVILNTGI